EQADDLPRCDVEVEAIQGAELTVVFRQLFRVQEHQSASSLLKKGTGPLRPFTKPLATRGAGKVQSPFSTGAHQRNLALTSGLTTFSAGQSPRAKATMVSAHDRAMSSRDCRSTPAACGVTTTLSSSNNGWRPGGSSSNTSRPAPARRLALSASYSAVSST